MRLAGELSFWMICSIFSKACCASCMVPSVSEMALRRSINSRCNGCPGGTEAMARSMRSSGERSASPVNLWKGEFCICT